MVAVEQPRHSPDWLGHEGHYTMSRCTVSVLLICLSLTSCQFACSPEPSSSGIEKDFASPRRASRSMKRAGLQANSLSSSDVEDMICSRICPHCSAPKARNPFRFVTTTGARSPKWPPTITVSGSATGVGKTASDSRQSPNQPAKDYSAVQARYNIGIQIRKPDEKDQVKEPLLSGLPGPVRLVASRGEARP
jgi:hypothetical protein